MGIANRIDKIKSKFARQAIKEVATQISNMPDEPEVVDILRYLREREVVHFQRFGEALRGVQDKLAQKKYYMNNLVDRDNNILSKKDCNCD